MPLQGSKPAHIRRSMSTKELQKKLEEQHRQIVLYEKKIKDVIRAYKSLESEKNALQAVVQSIGEKSDEPTGEANGVEASTTPESSSAEGAAVSNDDPSTVAQLKQALATLTKEKAKREAAYLNDKKVLLAENDALRAKMKETDEQADKVQQIIKNLTAKMKRIEEDRDRELADHGSILAEMQSRYAKEKQAADAAQKQLVELYKKLNDKEEIPNKLKSKEKEFEEQVAKLHTELLEWKKKAEKTPTIQLLQDQMANMKLEHEKSLEETLARTKQSSHTDHQPQRLAELEEKTLRLSERTANSEREKADALEALSRKHEEIRAMKGRIETLEAAQKLAEAEDTAERFKHAFQALRKRDRSVDVYEIIGEDPRLEILRAKLDRVVDEYEKYKLKAEAVLKAKQQPLTSQDAGEEDGLRALVGQLHQKLRALEVSHATDQAQYEMTTRNLRERISELERSEEAYRAETRKEMQQRVAEMEAEMQKQRNRTLDVLTEKERELEVTKSILVSVRSEQMACNAPLDPPQASSAAGKIAVAKRKSSEIRRYADARRISSGSRRSIDAVSVSSADYIANASDGNIPLPVANESRNMFYEDELAKKDREVTDMRAQLHHLDYRMREMEQKALCKDLQSHEMNERLKEEIRVLEGKLKLVSGEGSSGEIEYMRNIFVQYVNTGNGSGRKNILKAMAMVLKLSPTEMKNIEKM